MEQKQIAVSTVSLSPAFLPKARDQ